MPALVTLAEQGSSKSKVAAARALGNCAESSQQANQAACQAAAAAELLPLTAAGWLWAQIAIQVDTCSNLGALPFFLSFACLHSMADMSLKQDGPIILSLSKHSYCPLTNELENVYVSFSFQEARKLAADYN